jgi:hypothetical protein
MASDNRQQELLQHGAKQEMQQQAWHGAPTHNAAAAAAAAAGSSISTNATSTCSNGPGVLAALPSVEWMLLQQQQQHMERLGAAQFGGTGVLSAAIAAAAGGTSGYPAIPDSLLNYSAGCMQPLQEVPEYIPVVTAARMPSPFQASAHHLAAAAQAAAVTRAAAVSSETREVLLDLHPDAFVLVASSLDQVEKVSGAVMRIVERGQMPLGLRVLGRHEEVLVACALIRSLLTGC